jgi:glycosyltransferase involved in cell wall biosynthesis
VQGAILAQERLKSSRAQVSVRLQVAGQFANRDEEAEFRRLCHGPASEVVEHVGFISGDRKRKLMEEADLFCFPSHLESFGLVLAEAMAFGLPMVTTRCGALPEVVTSRYPGLVGAHAPDQIADAVLRMITDASFELLRERFLTHFTLERHLSSLATAFQSAL